ncbi:MAG: ParB/RepB/Spo0J family partition protein [Candidatus Aminicenantes bacterium]|nr:ParB/RepB/Spo0J family partition protein [Candidatus Aminicenantes bacterium]
MKKKALGKGLKAFIPEEYGILKDDRFLELEIEQLRPNPYQPRTSFDEQALEELSKSIRETGILQPVIVVPEKDYYHIIIGERRWRAAQKAGLKRIPAIIRNMSKEQQYEASLIENLQREDLNPLEIGQAYQKMLDDLNYTQQEIADKVGKDRASVANYIRLLKLPKEIQKMLTDQKLSMGHARALITLEDKNLQLACAHEIQKKNLTVRKVEKIIQQIRSKPEIGPESETSIDPNLFELQENLLKHLGTKVSISGNQNKGVIKIYYHTLNELNSIYDKIKGVKK